MENNKRYYWLKLKENFFEEDTINWLEEQENGKEYCLFYLKLCLKSLKTDGILIRNVGSILIPYDAKALSKITNTNEDTVRVAMELFKKIELIQILSNGEIYLTQLENMVGSETASTIRSRKSRENQKCCNATPMQQLCNVEKEIEIEIDKDIKKESKKKKFKKPTIEEIEQYCIERNNGINSEAFYDFYESKDWFVGKNKMKDWKACVRTWEKRNESKTIERKSYQQQKNEEFNKMLEEVLEVKNE